MISFWLYCSRANADWQLSVYSHRHFFSYLFSTPQCAFLLLTAILIYCGSWSQISFGFVDSACLHFWFLFYFCSGFWKFLIRFEIHNTLCIMLRMMYYVRYDQKDWDWNYLQNTGIKICLILYKEIICPII